MIDHPEASDKLETSSRPQPPDATETVKFLRRFADLMSNGHNATLLNQAAVWIETLSAQVTAADDEEQLWRYKYETLTHQSDLLEAECDALKHDIEGHVEIASAIIAERETLKAALQAREAELAELRLAFDTERKELRSQLEAQADEINGMQLELAKTKGQSLASQQPAADSNQAEINQAELIRARTQFEYLARDCVRRGDVASQAMCALGASIIDQVLSRADHSTGEEVALRILGSAN